MSIKSIILGMVLASFLWALFFFAVTFEYEVPMPLELQGFTVKENPVTQDRRVIDSETRTTVFWISGNPPIIAVDVKRIGRNRWVATFEKAH